jgi:fumarate reductase subunit D
MAKSNEPFWWALFSAGGVVAALAMPITILVTSIAVGADWISENRFLELLRNPLVRLYLFFLISLPLFHWAHRFRYTIVDLGVKAARGTIAALCYGTAVVGTFLALIFLFLIR